MNFDRLNNVKQYEHEFPNYLFSKKMFNPSLYNKFIREVRTEYKAARQLITPKASPKRVLFTGLDKRKFESENRLR